MRTLPVVAIPVAALMLAARGREDYVVGKWADGLNSGEEFLSGRACLITSLTALVISGARGIANDDRATTYDPIMRSTLIFVGQPRGNDLVFLAPGGKWMSPLHRVS